MYPFVSLHLSTFPQSESCGPARERNTNALRADEELPSEASEQGPGAGGAALSPLGVLVSHRLFCDVQCRGRGPSGREDGPSAGLLGPDSLSSAGSQSPKHSLTPGETHAAWSPGDRPSWDQEAQGGSPRFWLHCWVL